MLLLVDVVKALFYTCSSYPKVAAPHRLSPSDDYELCVLSSIVASFSVYDDVYNAVAELKRGERGIGSLDIGRNIAKALSACLHELGYRMDMSMCIAPVALAYVDAMYTEIDRDFMKAFRRFFNALQATDVRDVVALVKTVKNIGGELYILLDKAGISEQRILVEAPSLLSIFRDLAEHDKAFRCLCDIQLVLDMIKQAEDLVKRTPNINDVLSRVFLEAVKNLVEVPGYRVSDLIRIDAVYRKKGLSLAYLMPCLAFVSLYLVRALPR